MKLLHYLPLKVLCCILKTLRYLALKTMVTWSHDFSQRKLRGEGKRAEGDTVCEWRQKVSIRPKPSTLEALHYSQQINCLRIYQENVFLQFWYFQSRLCSLGWMLQRKDRSRCGRHNNLLGTSGACALFGAITRPNAKSHGTSTGLWTIHFLWGKNGRCRKLVFVTLYSNILYFKGVSFELTLWDIIISTLELMKPEYVLPI